MGKDVKDWLLNLKNRIEQSSSYPVERSIYHKPTMYSQGSQFALPMEVVYNDNNNNINESKKIEV